MFEATFTVGSTLISVTAASSVSKEHMVRIFNGAQITWEVFPTKRAALAAVKLLLA